MKCRGVILLLCAASAATLACDKSPAAAGADLPAGGQSCSVTSAATPSVSDACTAYVGGLQDYSERCVGVLGKRFFAPEQTKSCVQSVALPGSGFDLRRLASCGARVRTIDCTQGITDTCECRSISDDQRGTLPDGAACLEHFQCLSADCARAPDTDRNVTCGKCRARIPLGGACDFTRDAPRCDVGSACAQASKRCVAITTGKQGDHCESDGERVVQCDTGLYCLPMRGDDFNARVCARLPGLGDPCTTICSGVLHCLDGRCIKPALAGGACKIDEECGSALFCDESHHCAAPKELSAGESCSTLTQDRGVCGSGLYCNIDGDPKNAICAAFLPEGAPCTLGGTHCATGVCSNGRCTALDASFCR